MTFKKLFVVFAILVLGCKPSSDEQISKDIANSKLVSLFKPSNNNFPKISAHRGGKGLKNYPENCLETIKYVNDSINAIFEIDVAETKDGKLVLLHDNSIDRTTTGTGSVKQFTYEQLQNFYLVDDFGNETEFKIPLLSEVLKWCEKNEVILTIDIKRGVRQKAIVELIRETKAENISIIITYDINQAKSAFKLAPDLLLSVTARNERELNILLNSDIPTKNMLAFTGTRLSSPELYKKLEVNQIVSILGVLGNLDQRAKARGNYLYQEWLSSGVDILATDRPFEVSKVINQKLN